MTTLKRVASNQSQPTLQTVSIWVCYALVQFGITVTNLLLCIFQLF